MGLFHILLGITTLSYFLGNAPIEICAVVLCLYSGWILAKTNKISLLNSPTSILLGLFLLLIISKSLISDPSGSAFRPLSIAIFYIVGHGLAVIFRNEKDFTLYTKYALGITIIIVADIFVQYNLGHNIFGQETRLIEEHRLTDFAGNPRVGYSLAAISIPLIFHYININLVAGFCYGLAILIAVLLSGERTALLLTAGSIAATTIFGMKGTYRYLLAPSAIAVVLLGITLKPDLSDRFIENTSRILNMNSEYGQLYQTSANLIKQNFWFGVGSKNYHTACTSMAENANLTCNLHPHNIYLEIAVEQGALGLILFLCFIASTLVQLKGALSNSSYIKPFMIGCWCYIALKAFPLTPSSSIFRAWVMLPFFSYAGFIVASNKMVGK